MSGKKLLTAPLCFLLLFQFTALTLSSGLSSEVSVSSAPPIEIPNVLNSTATVDFNVTNVLSDETPKLEGNFPVYALVFGDEEERSEYYGLNDWRGYALIQIEQADGALAREFGIDIRALDFLPWDSDDSKDSIFDLIDELEDECGGYLDTFYRGFTWLAYVDIVIGVTDQKTDYPGCAYLNDRIAIVNWYCWDDPFFDLQWADDNLIRHEISHLFGAEDHVEGDCCVMAGHLHFVGVIIEDGMTFIVGFNVPCTYTTDQWCEDCHSVIMSNRGKFATPPMPYYSDGGTGGIEVPIDKRSLTALPLDMPLYVYVIYIAVPIVIFICWRLFKWWKQRKSLESRSP